MSDRGGVWLHRLGCLGTLLLLGAWVVAIGMGVGSWFGLSD